MINLLLLLLVAGIILGFVISLFRVREEAASTEEAVYSLEALTLFAKRAIETTLTRKLTGMYGMDLIRRQKLRVDLREALKHCMHGKRPDKLFVKNFLKQRITEVYNFTDDNVNLVIPFDSPERLSLKDKFDIMLYESSQAYGTKSFGKIVEKYEWNKPKTDPETFDDDYYVQGEELEQNFQQALDEGLSLTLDDKINIIVQRIFENYLGLGVIDEIRDCDIDGINGGSGGIPPQLEFLFDLDTDTPVGHSDRILRAHDFIVVFYKGAPIRLEFLSFGSELELERICQNIYTYASVGQLNEQIGHKISEMADNSRVVVTSPKLTDSYAFFLRKFTDELANIEDLITKPGADLLIGWIRFLALGQMTTVYTGGQGAGKTVLMRAAIMFMPKFWRFRVQEGSAFELWLRRYFPRRNIITFKETDKVSEADGLVIQKKTDGTVNLVGEAAADKTISSVLKTATVASVCSWFTHHANTARALVSACVDALIITGASTDSFQAEKFVSETLRYNIHLLNIQGDRYCERVSEYRPVDLPPLDTDFGKYSTKEEREIAFMNSTVDYYQRRISPKLYDVVDVIIYKDGGYVPGTRPSQRNIEDMSSKMKPAHRKQFLEFIEKHWPSEESAISA